MDDIQLIAESLITKSEREEFQYLIQIACVVEVKKEEDASEWDYGEMEDVFGVSVGKMEQEEEVKFLIYESDIL